MRPGALFRHDSAPLEETPCTCLWSRTTTSELCIVSAELNVCLLPYTPTVCPDDPGCLTLWLELAGPFEQSIPYMTTCSDKYKTFTIPGKTSRSAHSWLLVYAFVHAWSLLENVNEQNTLAFYLSQGAPCLLPPQGVEDCRRYLELTRRWTAISLYLALDLVHHIQQLTQCLALVRHMLTGCSIIVL